MMDNLNYGELVHNALLKYCNNAKIRNTIETLMTMNKNVNYGEELQKCLSETISSGEMSEEEVIKIAATIINRNETFINSFRKSVNEVFGVKNVNELTLDYELYEKNRRNFGYLINNKLVSFIENNKNTIISELAAFMLDVINKFISDVKNNAIDVTTLTIDNLNDIDKMYRISIVDFECLNEKIKNKILTEHCYNVTDTEYIILSYIKIPMLSSFDYFDIIKTNNKMEPQRVTVDNVSISYSQSNPLFRIGVAIELENPAEYINSKNKKDKKSMKKYKFFTYSLFDDNATSLHYALYRNALLSTNIWNPKIKDDE